MRIHQILKNKIATSLAIVDDDGATYTYGELEKLAAELSETLCDHGLRAGDRLALITENCALYVATAFACSMLDAWFVLVNARQTEDEIDSILQHSGARFALFTTQASPQAKQHAKRLNAVRVGELSCGEIVLSSCIDTSAEDIDPGENQTAALLYTTGTTSAPKAVMLSHKNLIFNATSSRNANSVIPEDRVLMVLPGTHIFGLATVFLQAMVAGATLHIMRRFEAEAVVSALENGITVYQGVPQMFAAIVGFLEKSGKSLNAPQLKVISSGGAPLDPALKSDVERIFGLNLNNGYGITETAAGVCTTDRSTHRKDCSVGPALEGVTVKIADANEDGIGEVWVKGDNVMTGYYHADDLTRAVMTDDGYFKTGDLARMDPDGALHITGRSKELIIRAGFNIYPPEVEAMLTKHPSILQASVIGRKTADDEEVLAFVQLREEASEADIKQWLRERLVGYKIPQRIIAVDRYPTAATGKILKHKLVSHFANEITSHEKKSGRSGE